MTPAEAIAEVREAVKGREMHRAVTLGFREDADGELYEDAPVHDPERCPRCKQIAGALAALALIEQEMARLFRENTNLGNALAQERSKPLGSYDIAAAEQLAAAAERERDELKVRATENWDSFENANRRIAQLEEALAEACRDLCESPEKYLALASGKEEG